MVSQSESKKPVRVEKHPVSPAQAGGDGTPVVEDCADVEGVVVIEQIHLGPLRGGLPLPRIQLSEHGGRLGPLPGLLVQLAIEMDGAIDPHGLDRWHLETVAR
jgi:hypothetical protein